jgi:aspartate carbamoyltransferase catalytic subunit
VHSLAPLLAKFLHIRLLLVSPAGLELPSEVVDECSATLYINTCTLEEVPPLKADPVMR